MELRKISDSRIIKEKQKCSLCEKIDMGVIEKNGEFICIRCFGKKYFTPEELAEIEKEATLLLEGVDDYL